MPLSETSYPPADELINRPQSTFLIFYSSREQGHLWCPHCRDVDGIVKSAFEGAKKPNGVIVSVGSFAEWKTPAVPHPARAKWGVERVPTIVKVQNGKEVAKLTKLDILDSDTLGTLPARLDGLYRDYMHSGEHRRSAEPRKSHFVYPSGSRRFISELSVSSSCVLCVDYGSRLLVTSIIRS